MSYLPPPPHHILDGAERKPYEAPQLELIELGSALSTLTDLSLVDGRTEIEDYPEEAEETLW